ncbi:MAG: hypothetical protein PHR77_13935 [Kiritimatiellae bacterium]|nr:hypothetical protein [Kiritimatiellia bacterium]MDD5521357.1 hypothetical protein [Kiritimatiellia bacterium]
MRTLLLIFISIAIIGCSKCENNTSAGATKDGKSPAQSKTQPVSTTARDVIEGMTGKTAVDQGKKAQDKIRAISADQNKKLNEVLNDK